MSFLFCKPKKKTIMDLTDTIKTHVGVIKEWECVECGHTHYSLYNTYDLCPWCGREIVKLDEHKKND